MLFCQTHEEKKKENWIVAIHLILQVNLFPRVQFSNYAGVNKSNIAQMELNAPTAPTLILLSSKLLVTNWVQEGKNNDSGLKLA